MKLADYSPTKPVFTTKEVVIKESPILYVFFDEDEDIHLIGKSLAAVEDAQIISISQAITLDPTLESLPDLVIGHQYVRNSLENGWTIN